MTPIICFSVITLYHVYMLFFSKKGAITFFSRMRLAWAKVAFAKGAVDYLNTLRDFMKITTFLASQAMLMGTCLHLSPILTVRVTLSVRERENIAPFASLECHAHGYVPSPKPRSNCQREGQRLSCWSRMPCSLVRIPLPLCIKRLLMFVPLVTVFTRAASILSSVTYKRFGGCDYQIQVCTRMRY